MKNDGKGVSQAGDMDLVELRLNLRAVSWSSSARSQDRFEIFIININLFIGGDQKYRKVVYESRGICAIFQLFSAASIQVRLFSKAAYVQFSVWHMQNESETWHCECYKHISNVNKHSGKRKTVGFSPTSTTIGRFFELRLLFECGSCATWVWRKCGFYSNAASVAFIHNFTVRQMALHKWRWSQVCHFFGCLWSFGWACSFLKFYPRPSLSNTFKPGLPALECRCSSSEKRIRLFIFKIYLRSFQLHDASDALLFLCLILLRRDSK